MRVVVQRVKEAAVKIGPEESARIGPGFLVLVGFTASDTESELQWMARKLPSLRVFEDDQGKMNRTLEETGGECLVVSQFTLYGDCRKGRRPSFDKSAPPEQAEKLYDSFVRILADASRVRVATGVFREYMQVSLVNDGPVTLILEKENNS
jgi:D-tyrosyl-tRNA(Tyr) deacylase